MNSNYSTDKTDESAIVTGETSGKRNCTYWVREDGREFVTDPNGDILNLSRLTAYVEHGEAIHDSHAHHELSFLKIDAPKFVDAVPPTEHYKLNHDDLEMVDGLPLIRADP